MERGDDIIVFKNVKELLDTGQLEGLPVTYISKRYNARLDGFIHGNQYACGCEDCNFEQVISAKKFEEHAMSTSNHANNHIVLQNGEKLHRIAKSLSNIPSKEFHGKLRSILNGCSVNKEGDSGSDSANEDLEEMMPRNNRLPLDVSRRSLGNPKRRRSPDPLFCPRKQRTSRHRQRAYSPSEDLLPSQRDSNITPDTFIKHVKDLLSTGLLEGFPIYYQKGDVVIDGRVRGVMYQCGCEKCNFNSVVSATDFEKHAGVSSKNQNNHIHLESNNTTLYRLVKALLGNTLGSLDRVIEAEIGCRPNIERFNQWKASFQEPRIEVQEVSGSGVEIRQTRHQNVRTSVNDYRTVQIQPDLRCEDGRILASFQEPRIAVQETNSSGVEIRQTEHQNIRTSANDHGMVWIQQDLHCEDDILLVSFQQPRIEVQETSGSDVEIQQTEHQNITTSTNDYGRAQIQPDLHFEDDRLLPSFQEPRIEVQETSGNGVEIQQTEHQNANDYGKTQIQLDLHCEDDRLFPSFQEPIIEVQETSGSGVEICVNDFGKVNIQPDLPCEDDSLDSLQEPQIEVQNTSGSVEIRETSHQNVRTSANDSGKVQIQPDHHCQDDSIDVGSLQTCSQFGLLPWRNNKGKLHSQHSNQISTPSSTSKDGIEGLQTPPRAQLQTIHPNSSVNQHTHRDTNLINGSESIPTQPGFIHTKPQLDIRNGVESPQVQIGQQLRRTCPNGSETMGTEPSLSANSEERNDTLLHNKSFVQLLEECENGNKDPHTQSEVNTEPHSHNRGPTEDSTNPTPSIYTFAIREKRPMLEDTSKHKFMSKSDSRRALFMDDGLPDGSELSYRHKGQIKRRGIKVKDGIVCICCNVKMSPSKFEAHAGHPETRQPYKNIYYDKDEITLDQFCDRLMSGQNSLNMAAGKCRICGGGGELIPCKCSNNFHAGCLKRQCAVDGYLRCLDCQHKLGPNSVARSTPSSVDEPENHRLTRIFVDVVEEYGRGCSFCNDKTVCIGPADDKTVITCRQCKKEYHLGCLKRNGCNLELEKEIENPPWFCSSHCSIIHYALFSAVCRESMVIHESPLGTLKWNEEEKQAKMEWQILSGQLKPSVLLDKVTAFFEDSFEPILRGVHNLLDSMVHGAQSHAGEYRGLCCAVLIVESVIVSAGFFRIFGTSVAELPLVATLRGSRKKGYFRTLFCLIERLLSFLSVEVLMVPIEEKQRKMWKKFGFKPMTNQQLFKYASEHPILTFANTTMLVKEIPYIKENLHTAIANDSEIQLNMHSV